MHKDVKYGRMNQLVLLRSERVRRRVWQYPRGGILRGLAPRGFMGHFVYARTGQGCLPLPLHPSHIHACTRWRMRLHGQWSSSSSSSSGEREASAKPLAADLMTRLFAGLDRINTSPGFAGLGHPIPLTRLGNDGFLGRRRWIRTQSWAALIISVATSDLNYS